MGQTLVLCTVRLSARTPAFHVGKMGSIPIRCTKLYTHDNLLWMLGKQSLENFVNGYLRDEAKLEALLPTITMYH